MREKICSIWSEDEEYAVRLADYINGKKLLPFNVMVFTDEQFLFENKQVYDIKLLIVDGEATWVKEFECETIVRLSEEGDGNTVSRYQPADRLAKEIISFMDGYAVRNSKEEKNVSINCIYSPATKCFKTTLALGLALWSAKKERSLYVNIEEFAGLDEGIFNSKGGLSQALYHFKVMGASAIGKILSCTEQLYGMDYFYPVICPEDISELTDKELLSFINVLAESGLYQSIWIDVGNSCSMPWGVMENADRIMIPNPLDFVGRKKLAQFENYLVASGRTELISKIEKVDIPYDNKVVGYGIDPEWILEPGKSAFYKSLLEE